MEVSQYQRVLKVILWPLLEHRMMSVQRFTAKQNMA
jgi:hypothetical protein